MYKLYSMQRSGNSYKVRLALALVNAPYHAIEVDILRGESRTPDFLAKNPSGARPQLTEPVRQAYSQAAHPDGPSREKGWTCAKHEVSRPPVCQESRA